MSSKYCTYKGKKPFDYEQLVFMVNVIMASAMDRIESCLPSTPRPIARTVFLRTEKSGNVEYWIGACLETAGQGLAALRAQTEGDRIGDGLGTRDALELSGLEPLAAKMVKKRTSKRWQGFKPGDKTIPDTRRLAVVFVRKMFKDYLEAQNDIPQRKAKTVKHDLTGNQH